MEATKFYFVWLSEVGTYVEVKEYEYQRLIDLGYSVKVDVAEEGSYLFLHMDHS